MAAAEELDRLGIGATVVDPRWILPINPHLTHLADRHRLVVTVEDSVRSAGMGTALGQACADAESTTPVRVMGLPQEFLAAGGREEILEGAGLGMRDIVATVVDGLRAGPRIAAPDAPELMEIPRGPSFNADSQRSAGSKLHAAGALTRPNPLSHKENTVNAIDLGLPAFPNADAAEPRAAKDQPAARCRWRAGRGRGAGVGAVDDDHAAPPM